jgi:hypothetical protein
VFPFGLPLNKYKVDTEYNAGYNQNDTWMTISIAICNYRPGNAGVDYESLFHLRLSSVIEDVEDDYGFTRRVVRVDTFDLNAGTSLGKSDLQWDEYEAKDSLASLYNSVQTQCDDLDPKTWTRDDISEDMLIGPYDRKFPGHARASAIIRASWFPLYRLQMDDVPFDPVGSEVAPPPFKFDDGRGAKLLPNTPWPLPVPDVAAPVPFLEPTGRSCDDYLTALTDTQALLNEWVDNSRDPVQLAARTICPDHIGYTSITLNLVYN